MKITPNEILLWAVAGVLSLCAIIYLHYFPQKNLSQPDLNQDLTYKNLVKPEDRKPLPKPKTERALKLPILMYHHIGNPPANAGPIRRDLTVSADEFEQQAKWLAENGFQTIRLEDIYLYSQGKFTMPKKSVVFTFDDGYQDVFVKALPILKKYGFTASFAIITQYPGETQGDNFYASWPQIAQAYQNGNEIVSHTQNHFDGKNPKFSSSYISQNLAGSIKDIKGHLGFLTKVLIYPYGHYTPEYVAQAKKAEFAMGITVHEGDVINLDNLMEIPRVRVHSHEDFERFKRLFAK